MRRLLSILVTFVCISIFSIGTALASPETWWKEWYQCQGYVKKWAATWHTHSSSGWPFKHLLKSSSSQWPGMCTNCWIPHNSLSPWFQYWEFCTAPLQTQRYYLFNDCNVIEWCWNCGQCRPTSTALFVPYESTYPQECQVP
jgi:hypothetical protein